MKKSQIIGLLAMHICMAIVKKKSTDEFELSLIKASSKDAEESVINEIDSIQGVESTDSDELKKVEDMVKDIIISSEDFRKMFDSIEGEDIIYEVNSAQLGNILNNLSTDKKVYILTDDNIKFSVIVK